MTKAPAILLVEDEEADVFHFKRLARMQGLAAEILVARDGETALSMMRSDALRGMPYIVLTDLNMPGLTGHELIEEIRADRTLSSRIVFVLSTSDLPEDVERAYRNNIAGYIVKDAHGERIEAAISMFNQYLRAIAL